VSAKAAVTNMQTSLKIESIAKIPESITKMDVRFGVRGNRVRRETKCHSAVLERAMVSKEVLADFESRPHSVDNESYFMRESSLGKGSASSRRKRQFFISRFDGSCSLTSFCVASIPVTGRPSRGNNPICTSTDAWSQ
jgi:hypothetical protein